MIRRYFKRRAMRRWIRRNLSYYRANPFVLSSRKIERKPLIMARLVDRQYSTGISGTLTIPGLKR